MLLMLPLTCDQPSEGLEPMATSAAIIGTRNFFMRTSSFGLLSGNAQRRRFIPKISAEFGVASLARARSLAIRLQGFWLARDIRHFDVAATSVDRAKPCCDAPSKRTGAP